MSSVSVGGDHDPFLAWFSQRRVTGMVPNQGWVAASWRVGIVLLACGAVYWLRLGDRGFSDTEGHRVIPGWEMLETRDWLVPRMFGQIYLRKPPGLPWAVVISSTLLGETEFAARAVSAAAATAMALLALVFATRWFGRPWGVAAGLMQALTPLFWFSGRAAEIESLNNLATQASVLLMLDLLIAERGRTRRATARLAALAGLAIAAMGLAKGPAGAPCLVGAILAACLATRSVGIALRPAVWVALLIPSTILGAAVGLMVVRAVAATGEPAVTQSVSSFLWSAAHLNPRRLLRIVALGPTTLVSALPVSLALLFPYGAAARREAIDEGGDGCPRSVLLARALGGACLLSLALFTLLGIDNPRYAMPAMTFVSPLVAYVLLGSAGRFTARRRALARASMLGFPWTWPILLLVAAQIFVWALEPRLRPVSGRDAGIALAAFLADRSEVWADQMIEARPEVLLYARRAAAAQGKTVRIRWVTPLADRPTIPDPGSFLLLGKDEVETYRLAGLLDRLSPITSGRVHKFTFTLFKVSPPPGPGWRQLSGSQRGGFYARGHPETFNVNLERRLNQYDIWGGA